MSAQLPAPQQPPPAYNRTAPGPWRCAAAELRRPPAPAAAPPPFCEVAPLRQQRERFSAQVADLPTVRGVAACMQGQLHRLPWRWWLPTRAACNGSPFSCCKAGGCLPPVHRQRQQQRQQQLCCTCRAGVVRQPPSLLTPPSAASLRSLYPQGTKTYVNNFVEGEVANEATGVRFPGGWRLPLSTGQLGGEWWMPRRSPAGLCHHAGYYNGDNPDYCIVIVRCE